MDYDLFCKRCRHYAYDPQGGILCRLTNGKPSFVDNCEDFVLDSKAHSSSDASATPATSSKEKPLPVMKESLRNWGIALIVLGVLHLVLTKFLDPIWGSIIIVLGILNLIIRKRGMFIANGTALLFVGLMNILGVVLPDGGASGWAFFGVLQLIWGVGEIRKFKRYSSIEPSGKAEIESDPHQAETTLAVETKSRHSGLGVASFILFIAVFLALIILYTVLATTHASNPQLLEQESIGMALVGFVIMGSSLLVLVGVGLGIAGIFQKEKRKVFSVLGLVFNFLMLLWLGFTMI